MNGLSFELYDGVFIAIVIVESIIDGYKVDGIMQECLWHEEKHCLNSYTDNALIMSVILRATSFTDDWQRKESLY